MPMMERSQQSSLLRDANAKVAEASVSAEWAIGDVILDTYEVKRVHQGGGMGLVYRVYHRGWNIDLAVKSPRAEYFRTEQHKQNFMRECETWINLGLHPHTVSCFYVRKLGGIPRVFAEYVEGGSLADWIKSRRLYAGGYHETLRRILDIAIQMAWGLHYAHEQGLVHQDVKPANVLMSPDGNAKIADFGLAKARSATLEPDCKKADRSILVSTGGMTPAYCSPEQARGEPLTRRTDIWSWAVSVLEMLVGGVLWRGGPVAAEVLSDLDNIQTEGNVLCVPPQKLKILLGHCLQPNPDRRPHDFAAVSKILQENYLIEFRQPFQRSLPDNLDLDADTKNNQVISLVDLGKVLTEESPDAYPMLLDFRKKHPDHMRGRLNDALIQWRVLGGSVNELNRQLDNMLPSLSAPELMRWLVWLEIEKCDTCRALNILESSELVERQLLSNHIRQQHKAWHQRLSVFFNEDKQKDRSSAYKSLMAQALAQRSEDASAQLFSVTGSETGIAAIYQREDNRIVLTNLRQNKPLGELTPAHEINRMAFSECGSFLAIAAVSRGDDGNETSYRLSVCKPLSFRGWTSYAGSFPVNLQLKEITVDDQCLCLTLWLEQAHHVFELIHDLRDGDLHPFRCDFRKPSHIKPFDRVYVNSDRTLLLTVTGSQCSLWRYPSAVRDDGKNVLALDLADFGLIGTTEHLPGFALARGFEFCIDEWNAHSLMRLLDSCRPKTMRAGYLLCKPLDTRDLFSARKTKATLLQFADTAEQAGDRLGALCHLNKYCAVLTSYEHVVMSRRHALTQALQEAYVANVWHHCSHNWYWESPILGLVPSGSDRITVQFYRQLSVIDLPGGELISSVDLFGWTPAGEPAEECSTKVSHVGIKDCGDSLFLTLMLRTFPYASRLALCTKDKSRSLKEKWSVRLAENVRMNLLLKKIVCLGKTIYVELQPSVVSALDLNSGLVRNQVRLAGDVLFLRALQTPEGESFLFVAIQSAGCVLLDTSLKPCEDWWGNTKVVQCLRPVEAVADDMSAIVGWLSPYRLVHVQMENLTITDVWNFWDRKYPVLVHELEHLYGFRHLVTSVALSPCGKVVSYVLWNYVVVVDIATGSVVLQWHRPWDNADALAFDSSGRWLVFAHAENQLEVFHLLWNVKDAPLETHFQ